MNAAPSISDAVAVTGADAQEAAALRVVEVYLVQFKFVSAGMRATYKKQILAAVEAYEKWCEENCRPIKIALVQKGRRGENAEQIP